MTNKARVRPASFKSVKFYVNSTDDGGGRRGVNHEYPDREVPFDEDTGKKSQTFTIEGFVSGSGYHRQRDALIKALEKPGKGRLVHPYRGTQWVRCTDYRVREADMEGGIARFTMSFVEAGKPALPTVKKDSLVGSVLAAMDSVNAAVEGFSENFTTDNFPQFVIESATDKLDALSGSLGSMTQFIMSTPDGVADLVATAKNFGSEVVDLVRSPYDLGVKIGTMLGLISSAGDSPSERLTTFNAVYMLSSNEAPGPTTTPSRIQEEENRKAINTLVKTVAVAGAVQQAADIEFTSRVEAEAVRDDLVTKIDSLMEETPSDKVFASLQALRTALVQAVPDPSQTLSEVKTVRVQDTASSLEVVYEQYGNLALEADFVARNKIAHPGFIPGGGQVEVLSNG